MTSGTIQHIWALVEPIAADEGLEIVDIELHHEGRGAVVRVFMDRRGGDGAVDLDTLAGMSRQVGDVLDAHDALPGRYTLELSSPGVNRRLRAPDHFRRYVGRRIRVRSTTPISGRRTFAGTLQAVAADGVTIAGQDGDHFVPFHQIARANYEHDFGDGRSQRADRTRRHHAAGTQSGH